MRTLIRHGIVVTPEGAAVRDVLVEDERIADVGPHLAAASADRTVDATGKYVIPGGAPGVETRLSLLFVATLHMNVDYSPFEGREVQGAPDLVLSRGQVVAERGRFVGRPGAGRFVRRAAR